MPITTKGAELDKELPSWQWQPVHNVIRLQYVAASTKIRVNERISYVRSLAADFSRMEAGPTS
ncbi:hypothetical protein KFK09_014098 [Dendrobium nobile]|uniref:Uncharacterized protein n=1 Tax=Dendrobium nobile TaxID=94219 RepID=A0A8T3BAW4_DENNO|nr:hypothetical protein KFK09_014098 [Dendrobium nobile]